MDYERRDVIFKATVLAGGGDYCGIQHGSRQFGVPDLILLNDPITGTTLALVANASRMTAQQVEAKIKRSRALFVRTAANVLDLRNQ